MYLERAHPAFLTTIVVLVSKIGLNFFFQVSPWNGAFRSYINNIKNSEKSFEELMKDEAYFRDKFTQFLFSPRGAIFQV